MFIVSPLLIVQHVVFEVSVRTFIAKTDCPVFYQRMRAVDSKDKDNFILALYFSSRHHFYV